VLLLLSVLCEVLLGSKLNTFVIVTSQKNGKHTAYKADMVPGISGVDHTGALCKNVEDTDFNAVFSVNKYTDGVYDLGIVLYYENAAGETVATYHKFTDTITVKNGKVVEEEASFSSGEADEEEGFKVEIGEKDEDEDEDVGFVVEAATEAPTVDAFGAPIDPNMELKMQPSTAAVG